MRFQLATGQLDNPMRIRMSEEYARVTVLREREIRQTLNGRINSGNRRRDYRIERAARKVRIGRVVSDKMDKTVVVSVETVERPSLRKGQDK